MLDNTVLLYGCAASEGGHASWDLPIVCAGNSRGRLRQGAHLDFQGGREKKFPLSNLFVTMLQGMGIEQDDFVDSTGTIGEMLA